MAKKLEDLLEDTKFTGEVEFLYAVMTADRHKDLDMNEIYMGCRNSMIKDYDIPNYVLFELAYHNLTEGRPKSLSLK